MSEPSEYELTVKSTAVQVSIMSLRDYFASAVMQGIYSGRVIAGSFADKDGRATLASLAYQQADAMLAERAKP